jgi:peptide/nickel transport system permease protein
VASTYRITPANVSAAPSRGRRLLIGLRRLFEKPASAFGATITLVFLFIAIFGPALAPYQQNQMISEAARHSPSAQHWFGTDHLGRDVYSRVILGAREILVLSGLGTLIAIITGTFFGLITGYQGKWFDEIIMRFFDSLLSIPALLFALLLLGVLGSSRYSVLIVILIVYTPIIARVVRSVVISVKAKAFVEAARLRGETPGYILFREIMPSVYPALSVEAALRFSYAIFLVASLGFLGVGVQPPNPNWGLMVKEARATVTSIPWALYFPAGAISMVVIGINLMADGLRRVLQSAEVE